MKSVDRKRELRSVTIVRMIALLASVSLAATRVRMVKTLRASETESVPSAESFRPVNGNVSGPRWHWLLRLTRQTWLTSGSIRSAEHVRVAAEEADLLAVVRLRHVVHRLGNRRRNGATGTTGPNCSSVYSLMPGPTGIDHGRVSRACWLIVPPPRLTTRAPRPQHSSTSSDRYVGLVGFRQRRDLHAVVPGHAGLQFVDGRTNSAEERRRRWLDARTGSSGPCTAGR